MNMKSTTEDQSRKKNGTFVQRPLHESGIKKVSGAIIFCIFLFLKDHSAASSTSMYMMYGGFDIQNLVLSYSLSVPHGAVII